MKKLLLTTCFILTTVFLVKNSWAHHALEYIEMESYSTARKGEFVFYTMFDYMVDDVDDSSLDHWEFTPGLSYGIIDRLMVDVHTHFAKFGNGHAIETLQADYAPGGPSPFIEAVAISLQGRVTEGLPVDIGLLGLVEIPLGRSRDLLDGQEVYEGTLIIARDFGEHRNLCLNLTLGRDGDETVKHWALGGKLPLTQDPNGIAAGLEFLGSFEDPASTWSVLPGIYLPVGMKDLIFKTGMEVGINGDSLRVNASLMYRFAVF